MTQQLNCECLEHSYMAIRSQAWFFSQGVKRSASHFSGLRTETSLLSIAKYIGPKSLAERQIFHSHILTEQGNGRTENVQTITYRKLKEKVTFAYIYYIGRQWFLQQIGCNSYKLASMHLSQGVPWPQALNSLVTDLLICRAYPWRSLLVICSARTLCTTLPPLTHPVYNGMMQTPV